jgi:hypothetical protein
MKRIYCLIILLFPLSIQISQAECVLVPLSLSERVNTSALIVEGVVDSKVSYWNHDKSMIYTASRVSISRIYKGSQLIQSQTLNVITLGGTVGNKAIRVEPELELTEGAIGIFMLVDKDGEWVSESGPQGFINIDKHTAEANDMFNTYPAFSIANTIKALTKTEPVNINEWLTKIKLVNKRAAPTITSISPSTITAGTSSILTIKGTNFQSIRDTNSVQFKNGDDGGLSFIKALMRDYISWNDTMIRLIVRAKAGTGKIRVVAGSNGNQFK